MGEVNQRIGFLHETEQSPSAKSLLQRATPTGCWNHGPRLSCARRMGRRATRSRSPSQSPTHASAPSGLSEGFDIVILAVGFGLEKGKQPSYWRNETFAQPQLGQATMTYIVSGSGDGAMIDLFRLRISEFRQDRILAELFNNRTNLLAKLRELDLHSRNGPINLFECFNELWDDQTLVPDTLNVRMELERRLRHDTQVVLHVRTPTFADLFNRGRVSFQNRRRHSSSFAPGGFHPSMQGIDHLASEYHVPPERIIRRHGTRKRNALLSVLADDLHPALAPAFEDDRILRQSDNIKWTGGYFDYAGPIPPPSADETVRAHWRKEYLPSPTQAGPTGIPRCSCRVPPGIAST